MTVIRFPSLPAPAPFSGPLSPKLVAAMDAVAPGALARLESVFAQMDPGIAAARMAAASNLLRYGLDFQAPDDVALEAKAEAALVAAREDPGNARVIAMAAAGRAECCDIATLLGVALSRIPQSVDDALTAWLNGDNKVGIHEVVLAASEHVVGSRTPHVAVYAIYYRLVWLAADNTEYTSPEELAFEFGLFI